MRCLEASELMSLRLDLDLPREREQTLEEHLAVCASCRHEWRMMQQVCGALGDVSFAAPSPMFLRRVMARIRKRSAWLGTARGGLALFLGAVTLLSIGIMPLRVVSYLVTTVSESPCIVSATVGAVVGLVDVLNTVLRAGRVVLEAVFASPGWVVILGYVVLCGVLALSWVRVAVWPRRPVASRRAP